MNLMASANPLAVLNRPSTGSQYRNGDLLTLRLRCLADSPACSIAPNPINHPSEGYCHSASCQRPESITVMILAYAGILSMAPKCHASYWPLVTFSSLHTISRALNALQMWDTKWTPATGLMLSPLLQTSITAVSNMPTLRRIEHSLQLGHFLNPVLRVHNSACTF